MHERGTRLFDDSIEHRLTRSEVGFAEPHLSAVAFDVGELGRADVLRYHDVRPDTCRARGAGQRRAVIA